MDKAAVTLQVFFEDSFWVGIFERVSAGKLEACKVTFGPEPKDYEVLDFIRKGYFGLRFSPAVEATVKSRPASPKRMQREARRQVQNVGIGTKSQQALGLQHEQMKIERKVLSRQKREEEKQRLFELKQQKRKEKHRGR
ncbi:YjdF family protein [Enterocloster asparagiformis]|uniref:YjdF family protein n=1 Tax=Enterocloster asparagiformis TaxID=333367 RepID=UPI000463D8DE|nr:YjdF family protein [Enterocloster asparagiformis]